MNPDQFERLQAIVERPGDDWPRLVYADWLDDNGSAEHAELIRIRCAMNELAIAKGGLTRGPEPGQWFPTPHRLALEGRAQELEAIFRSQHKALGIEFDRAGIIWAIDDVPSDFEAIAAELSAHAVQSVRFAGFDAAVESISVPSGDELRENFPFLKHLILPLSVQQYLLRRQHGQGASDTYALADDLGVTIEFCGIVNRTETVNPNGERRVTCTGLVSESQVREQHQPFANTAQLLQRHMPPLRDGWQRESVNVRYDQRQRRFDWETVDLQSPNGGQ
jgi:uncharacterized protein (TIGR02996 family)